MPNPVLDSLKIRLEAWAEWYSRDSSGLGYSWCSMEYRILTGGSATRSGAPPPLLTNRDAEEIEAWVCEMARQNPQMASVLRTYYFYPRSLRQHALRLQMSYTEFKFQLGMAHQWLAGRWSRG